MRGLLLLALFAECNASLIIRDDINSNADGSNQFNTALNSDIGTTDLSAETAQLLNPGTDVTASSDNLLALGSLTGDNPSILDPTTPETSASTPPDSYLVAGSASDKNVWQLGWDGIAAVYSVLASCAHSLLSYSLTMGQSGSLARESSTDYNTKKQDLCPVPTYAHRGKALCDKGVMHVQYIRTLKTFILHGFTTCMFVMYLFQVQF